MDVEETLRIIRATMQQMAAEDQTPTWGDATSRNYHQHARDLVEHVTALDEWLTKGGFPPAAWLH